MAKLIDIFKKPLESVSDEITTKFKTPFFSIYTIVWIIRNNIFIYDLFFNTSIVDKTTLLNNQFNIGEGDFYLQTFYSIVITLGLLVVYYLIINISRTITVISEERIKLNILELFQSKTIGSKDDVDFWRNKADDLNDRNRILEEKLGSLRSNLKFSNTQLEEAKSETERIKRTGQQAMGKLKSMLHNHIYVKQSASESFGMNNIKKMREEFDIEFNNYEIAVKPRGFLRV